MIDYPVKLMNKCPLLDNFLFISNTIHYMWLMFKTHKFSTRISVYEDAYKTTKEQAADFNFNTSSTCLFDLKIKPHTYGVWIYSYSDETKTEVLSLLYSWLDIKPKLNIATIILHQRIIAQSKTLPL